jgi:predicted aspartyl protease
MRSPWSAPAAYRHGLLLLSGLAAISLSACDVVAPARVEAPADTAAGEVDFRFAGPNDAALLVPVYVNGAGPYDFVLDTGATLTCLEQNVVAELALPQVRGAVGIGAGVGAAGRMELVRVDSLRLGAARAFEMTACVLDLRHMEGLGVPIDGLLGLNFLRAFHVTLDFEREVVTLLEPASVTAAP